MNEITRILVIDDEEVVHISIKRILSRFGYQVDGVLSAAEGLAKLEEEDFDAVITDLVMPKMNGLEMLAAMKERQINTPSIMVTGYPTIKTAIQALRLGAVDYIPKPFTRKELLGPLQRTLRRNDRGVEKSLDQHQDTSRGTDSTPPPKPGDCFILPEHSWVNYKTDGTAEIGIEPRFLSSVPPIEEINLPLENDLVEQGYPGIELKAKGEVHNVFMPLSGRVIALNQGATVKPEELTAKTWLIRVLPSELLNEITLLKKRDP